MALSLHEASVPVFRQGLRVMVRLLDKAAVHGPAPEALITARLAPDMYTLAGQVQCASDAAKLCVARLAGVERPSFPDTETTYPELHDRIARTIAFIEGVDPAAIEAGATRSVTLKQAEGEVVLPLPAYLLHIALPNFFFHVTTAYDILRHHGLPLRKADYLGL
jgi:uncharacterized protein